MNLETSLARSAMLESDDASSVALDPDTMTENLVFGFGPSNEQLHPFFMMRSNLLKHMKATGQQVFAVTSVEPGDGKTHTAINLAAVLGRIMPTVLIELDLRQPSVGERLGLPESVPGMDDFLRGDAAWSHTRIDVEGADLAIHRARGPSARAEVLLNSPRLGDAIDRVRSARCHPVCIIDTPPALANDDLVLIAREVDGILIVAQEAKTRKHGLIDVANALSPTPIIGSVLNMSISEPARVFDYGYYYGKTGGRPG